METIIAKLNRADEVIAAADQLEEAAARLVDASGQLFVDPSMAEAWNALVDALAAYRRF